MPFNHLTFCHPLLLLPSIFPSIRAFFKVSVLLMRCPKYWSFSFSISPSSKYSGLISFRIDWLDLLVVQGTIKSILQHPSLKASVLQPSAFFTSNSYIHTWLLEKPWLWLYRPLLAKWYLCFPDGFGFTLLRSLRESTVYGSCRLRNIFLKLQDLEVEMPPWSMGCRMLCYSARKQHSSGCPSPSELSGDQAHCPWEGLFWRESFLSSVPQQARRSVTVRCTVTVLCVRSTGRGSM